MAEPRTYPTGVTSWIDLEQPDLRTTTDFYGGLLGWTFSPATPPGEPMSYLIARLDQHDVAGLAGPASLGGPAEPRGWTTYVAADDLDVTTRAVVDAGGSVVHPPQAAGPGGWWAECADPAGAVFRLWRAGRRLGVQVANVPGAWNFSDLHAADPAGAQAFYERVFGWVFADLGFATMIRVPGYADHLAATSDPGIHERQAFAPPGFADVIGALAPATAARPPGWHVTFTVADRDATAARVEELGGQVLLAEDDEWTRTALVEDPQGARFTASQFTPPG